MLNNGFRKLRDRLALHSLRSRILFASLLGSLLISALTAYMVGSITLRHHNTHLLEDTEQVLRNLVDVKRLVVESRLSDMEKGLLVFAANPDLATSTQALWQALDESRHRSIGPVDAAHASTKLTDYYQRQSEIQGIPFKDMMALRQSLDTTSVQLQYQGMLDTATRKNWPAYWAAHDRIDPFLRTFRIAFPWYDLLLLDPSEGRVLYTDIKEVDFGARVTQGPLAKTALARIYEQIRNQSGAAATVVHDYAAYTPSGTRETLFIGVPVRNGKTLTGVLVAQVDSEDFHQRLTNHNDWTGMGLGERGDLFLTGANRSLRSHSRFEPEYLRAHGIHHSGFTAVAVAANTPLAPKLHGYPVVVGRTPNLLGEPSHHAVVRIQHPQLDWALHAYIAEAEIAAQAELQQQNVLRQALLAGMLTLFLTGLISLGLAGSISKPIRRLAEFLDDIEKTGDLWQRPPSTEQRSSEEIQGIYAAVDRFLQTLATQRLKERKQQSQLADDQQRLQELSHFNDTLLSAISEHALVSLTDMNGHITYVNERFQQISQYPTDALLGQTHAFVSSGQHTPAFYGDLWHTIGNGQIWHGEICNRKKDGTLFWVEAAIVPNRNQVGEFVGFTSVSMDITERKQDAARMHASLSTLRALLEAIPYPVFLKDTQSHYVECNDAFCEMTGKPRHALLGKTPYEISPKEYADSYLEADQTLYNSPSGQQVYENRVINSAGQIREIMFHKRVHMGLNGKPEGLVGIAIDVTEFRNTERELRYHRDRLQELVDERTADLTHAKNEAERANHAKSEFLANITHELRTPLHAIISFTRLAQSHLKRSDLETVPEFLDDIYLASQRQLHLVNDLLDLAKVEAGRMTLSIARQNVQTLLESSVRGVTPLLDSKSLQLTWQITTQNLFVDVDSTRMQQVFANLLSNAIKFSPEGGLLRLRLSDDELPAGRRESDPRSQPALRIDLSDAGIGIPEEDLHSIFDKFVQSRRTKTGSGGTGLGLAICREIVTLHGGRIHAANNPDGGATFSLVIPRPGTPD